MHPPLYTGSKPPKFSRLRRAKSMHFPLYTDSKTKIFAPAAHYLNKFPTVYCVIEIVYSPPQARKNQGLKVYILYSGIQHGSTYPLGYLQTGYFGPVFRRYFCQPWSHEFRLWDSSWENGKTSCRYLTTLLLLLSLEISTLLESRGQTCQLAATPLKFIINPRKWYYRLLRTPAGCSVSSGWWECFPVVSRFSYR